MEKTVYLKKRNATRSRIDRVFAENFRSTGGVDLTVKEICEKAGINRSTFYTYYNDTVDMKKQIESRLIKQFRERILSVVERAFDDPRQIMLEVMSFNRENGHLPLLLISSGSSDFVYSLSRTAAGLIAGDRKVDETMYENLAMIFTYHFAGLSMLIRQLQANITPSDENYNSLVQKLMELLLPVVKNGVMPAVKKILDQTV